MSLSIKSQKGFVILLAIVISASILMIGAGIFGSAFKQTILASTSTESQIALFVADTGMECALYTEFVNGGVWEMCAGEIIQDSGTTQNLNNCVLGNPTLCSYTFTYRLPGTPGCGKVSVERNTDQLGNSNNGTGTSIIARGYNFCTENNGQLVPDTNNSTLVERRLEVWYPNALPPVEPDLSGLDPNPGAPSNGGGVTSSQIGGSGGGTTTTSFSATTPRP